MKFHTKHFVVCLQSLFFFLSLCLSVCYNYRYISLVLVFTSAD